MTHGVYNLNNFTPRQVIILTLSKYFTLIAQNTIPYTLS